MILRLGTRGSQLALTQAHLLKNALLSHWPDLSLEIVTIETLGDRKQITATKVSDKKEWIHELEVALLDQRIDIALHSGKDIPIDLAANTVLWPVLARANPLDVFIGKLNPDNKTRLTFSELTEGATIGTSSTRRQAQLLRLRSDLQLVDHRGNVLTRLKKLDHSDTLSGIILAYAGLERLQLMHDTYQPFEPHHLMPAINQGTLVAQYLANHPNLEPLLQTVTPSDTHAMFLAERSVAEMLRGDCQSAICGFSQCNDKEIMLSARVMLPDGSQCISASAAGSLAKAKSLGLNVGRHLLDQGAREILDQARRY